MRITEWNQFLYGALWLASTLAGFVFLRYWQRSRDRLFLFFSLAFWTLATQWLLQAIFMPSDEDRHYFFFLRLGAFLLIIVAIVDKNRRARKP